MVKLLVGAWVYPSAQHSQTPDHLFMAQPADVNISDYRGFSPLQIASDTENQEMVRLLVEHGADIEQKDSKGLTALHHAIIEGRESAVKLLIELGADVCG